jgi:hypothetical protein
MFTDRIPPDWEEEVDSCDANDEVEAFIGVLRKGKSRSFSSNRRDDFPTDGATTQVQRR